MTVTTADRRSARAETDHFFDREMAAARAGTHSLLVGYLLWILGFTGAHRFYYGKPITGTIWFFTLGLLGVGWLIDVFLIPLALYLWDYLTLNEQVADLNAAA